MRPEEGAGGCCGCLRLGPPYEGQGNSVAEAVDPLGGIDALQAILHRAGSKKSREEMFAKAGIEAFHGRARSVGRTAVQVGEDILEGRYVVIAAGQKPTDLKIPGTDHLTTSEQFLELDELPKRILFIGGGYIAFEFAHVVGGIASHHRTSWRASASVI